jgi:aminomethyltransferase
VHALARLDAAVAGLTFMTGAYVTLAGTACYVTRSGYTGEDGFEISVPADAAVTLAKALLAQPEVRPAGLGARDTLRLEAGMALYGQDMDESTTPFEAGLAWTVAMEPADRDFVGRAALESQLAAGVPRQVVGLLLEDKGVLRHGQRVITANGDGEVLSGTFSPTIGKSIALARVPAGDPGAVAVDVRGRTMPVRVVRYPFVREGKVRV